MVKVTIERNGEVSEFEGDAVFGGVIADGEDATDVNAFLIGRTCEQDTPKIMADVMCRLVKGTRESGDASERMEALVTFTSAVNEIARGEVEKNQEACEEMLQRMLRKVMEV